MEMTRFEALADAYGADLRRWPHEEQEAARALLEREPSAARAILAAADDLDALLAASPAPAPSQTLRDAIFAAAPKARPRRALLGYWLPGAGLAAAALAGVIVGTATLSAITADARAEAVLAEALPDDALGGTSLDELPLGESPNRTGGLA